MRVPETPPRLEPGRGSRVGDRHRRLTQIVLLLIPNPKPRPQCGAFLWRTPARHQAAFEVAYHAAGAALTSASQTQ
jgi:hypothetical protein